MVWINGARHVTLPVPKKAWLKQDVDGPVEPGHDDRFRDSILFGLIISLQNGFAGGFGAGFDAAEEFAFFFRTVDPTVAQRFIGRQQTSGGQFGPPGFGPFQVLCELYGFHVDLT